MRLPGRPLPGRFTCGGWTVAPELDRIGRGGISIHLRPRVMEVLVYLAARPGRVVPDDELVDALWPGEFVADGVLKHAVCELRRLLGDDPAEPRFIETIPKRGYRMVALIGTCEEESPAAAEDRAAPSCDAVEPRTGTPPPAVGGSLLWGDDEILVSQGVHLIGRSLEASVVIRHPKVSRRHALLSVTGAGVFIEDLGSTNGTFLCGRRLEGRAQVGDGDRVRLGPVEMIYRHGGERSTGI